MRSVVQKTIVFALLTVFAAGFQAAAATANESSVKLLKCKKAVEPGKRYLSVSARMGADNGEAMAIKLELLKKEEGSSTYSVIQTPLVGSWEEASPDVSSYTVRKRVANLAGPANYRAQVTFRWTNSAGKTTTIVRKSKVCAQTDDRADLVTSSLQDPLALPVAGASYPVIITNKGNTVASSFKLALAIDGIAQASAVTVTRLFPGANRLVPVEGYACFLNSQLVFTVDSENTVEETDETNNTLSVNCPPAIGNTRSTINSN